MEIQNRLNLKQQVIFDIKDKPIRIDTTKYNKKAFEPPEQKQISKKHQITVSRKIVNDYVDIVNKRQDIVDTIKDSAKTLEKLSTQTRDYFTKYYSPDSQYKKQMNSVVDLISPEYKYIKTLLNSNSNKIQSMLTKQQQEPNLKQKSQEPPIKVMKYQTQKNKLLALNGAQSRKLSDEIGQDDKQDDEIQEPSRKDKYHSEIENIYLKEYQKQNRIQSQILDNQLRWQGKIFLQQSIFEKSMKQSSLTPKAHHYQSPFAKHASKITKFTGYTQPDQVFTSSKLKSQQLSKHHVRFNSQYTSTSNNNSQEYIYSAKDIRLNSQSNTNKVKDNKNKLNNTYFTFSKLIQHQKHTNQKQDVPYAITEFQEFDNS